MSQTTTAAKSPPSKRLSKSRTPRAKTERAPFVSHFTPGLMLARVLEDIFVGRAPLADRLLELVRSSATSNAKQHTLLIGPRGFGKSHLVALTYHRIQEDAALREGLRVAWLREEEWGVTSFLDLLLRVFRALNEEYPGELPTQEWETLYELDVAGAQAKAVRLLREFVGERTLLVLLENADDIFAGLGDGGQKHWRAFLQENGFCSTIATSPSLFNGVSRRESPFFGFFRVVHLEPLSLDEAVELLHRLATLRGDEELAGFLLSATGRARVRAIHHLAGGSPRVYVIFSQFLTRETLDELVEPFLGMLDELTPYYGSRMQLLSPQQRKIVEFLCDYRGAAAVKTIASRGFMSQQTASGQLLDLKEKGYVVPRAIGRETFYELREPLMRLCIEVKKNRGEPIGLLVDFLRLWYPLEQLRERLVLLDSRHRVERFYVERAIELASEEGDPRVKACQDDALRFYDEGNYEAALKALSDLVVLYPKASSYLSRAYCFLHLKRSEDALRDLTQAIELDAGQHQAWSLRALVLEAQNQKQKALSDLNQAITLSPEPTYLLSRASLLLEQNQKQEANEDVQRAIKIYSQRGDKEKVAATVGPLWLASGELFQELGQTVKAKNALRRATRSEVDSWEFYNQLSLLWQRLEEPKFALQALEKAILLNPSEWGLRLAKCMLEIRQEKYLAALRTLDEAEKASMNKEIFHPEAGIESEHLLDYFRAVVELARGRLNHSLDFLERTIISQDDEVTKDDGLQFDHYFRLRREQIKLLWWFVPAQRWASLAPKIIGFLAHRNWRVMLQLVLIELISLVVAGVTPTTPEPSKTAAWYSAWKQAIGEHEELQLALRLMETAIRFRQTSDERILLELPIEERKMLEYQLKEIESLKSAE